MCCLRLRDALGRIVQEPCEPAPHLIALCKCEIPHVIDMFGSIEPRLLLRFERHVRPRLVRVAGEQNAFGNAKAGVVLGQLLRIDQSADRIAQRSGNAGWLIVVKRYSAPAEPPVPGFVPIVRWTIFTCRYRHSMNPSSKSTSRSAIWATVGFFLYISTRIRWTSGDGSHTWLQSLSSKVFGIRYSFAAR